MLTGRGEVLQVLTSGGVIEEVAVSEVTAVSIEATAPNVTVTSICFSNRAPIRLQRDGDRSHAERALAVPLSAVKRARSQRRGTDVG